MRKMIRIIPGHSAFFFDFIILRSLFVACNSYDVPLYLKSEIQEFNLPEIEKCL